jgi:hypothetical protein
MDHSHTGLARLYPLDRQPVQAQQERRVHRRLYKIAHARGFLKIDLSQQQS